MTRKTPSINLAVVILLRIARGNNNKSKRKIERAI
jgi:hypothetical protein